MALYDIRVIWYLGTRIFMLNNIATVNCPSVACILQLFSTCVYLSQGKEARVWDLDNRDATSLDYSRKGGDAPATNGFGVGAARPDYLPNSEQVSVCNAESSIHNYDTLIHFKLNLTIHLDIFHQYLTEILRKLTKCIS